LLRAGGDDIKPGLLLLLGGGMYYTHTSARASAEPAVEPVTVDEVMEHGRVDDAGGDRGLIAAYITAARQAIEAMTGRALITRTVVALWDAWPAKRDGVTQELLLPFAPVSAVSKIEYYNGDNVLTLWAAANYDADIASQPARIRLAYGATWPVLRSRPNAIQATYSAGYGATGASVPVALRIAVRAAALDLYERRGQYMESSLELRNNRAVWNLIQAYMMPVVG